MDAPIGSGSGQYALVDQLAEEFADRYRRGERPSLKEYTDRYPDLAEEIRELFPALVNHRAPSGPVVIARGPEMLGSVKFDTTPAVVIRPIERLPALANHNAPSGPTVMFVGYEMLGSVKFFTTPLVVIRPMDPLPATVAMLPATTGTPRIVPVAAATTRARRLYPSAI